ncbi:hypothetical protein TRFO_30741 [Tritrichomonas foetus]|uniref:Uncharacterized protein n=1 Tax=Tritrichomonas foetus TaxID=1144522 RepID=A0A1J4JSY5_9EUKA|nr:hypothetical protein TRFO_30741 [Tritrichomonas foetus]|eukprot:OHT02225.1 hypothetical protein TRFO_30741 [Tritrichomonas foetus]
MFAIFLALSFSFKAGNVVNYCICDGSCPSQCSNFEKIDSSNENNLDNLFAAKRKPKMNVYILPTKKFSLSLNTFDKINCSFTSLDLTKTAEIEVNSLSESSAKLSFNYIKVSFLQTNINLHYLKLNNSDVTIKDGSLLITRGMFADNSLPKFHEIIIEGGVIVPSCTLTNVDDSITIKERTLLFEKNAKITFPNEVAKSVLISNSSKISIHSNKKGDVSKFPQVTLSDIQELTFSGDFPKSSKSFITIKNSIKQSNLTCDSTVLPVSFESANDSIDPTEIITFISLKKSKTEILGHVSNVKLSLDLGFSSQSRVSVVIDDTFSGFVDLHHNLLDLQILDLDIDFTLSGSPFGMSIGVEGVSTITATTKTFKGTAKLNGVDIFRLFNSYKSDSELKTLLSQKWDYLKITGPEGFSASTVAPWITYESNIPFVHGFSSTDSVITTECTSMNPLIFTMAISKPSQKELNLCYSSSCSTYDGQKVEKEDLASNLGTKWILTGMKTVTLKVKNSIDLIDFTNLKSDVNEMNLTILSDSIKNVIKNMKFSPNLDQISNITIQDVSLGSIEFSGRNITFINCFAESESTKISCENTMKVNVDDYFIQNFGNKIEGKIPHFLFMMDYYETINITDDDFIFTDDMKYVDKAIVKRSSFPDLDILYNIGKNGKNKNQLALIASSTSIPSFSVTVDVFNMKDTAYTYKSTLYLYNWSIVTSSYKVIFDHDDFPLTVVLNEPLIPDQLAFAGKGEISYVNNYTNKISVCSCVGNECETECAGYNQTMTFSQLELFLDETKYNYIDVKIVKSTDWTPIKITTSCLDSKTVMITCTNRYQEVHIDGTKELQHPKLSTTRFSNLTLFFYASNENSKATFGELYLHDIDLENWNNVDVTVDDLICDYKTLMNFGNIKVMDSCTLDGKLPTTEKEISFVADDNSEDLKATIEENTEVIVGKNYVKIGKLKFLIQHSDMFDIILTFSDNLDVKISPEPSVSSDSMPRIRINRMNNPTLKFDGNWKIGRNSRPVLDFLDLRSPTLYLGSKNLSADFNNIYDDFHIIATKSNVGIDGHFYVYASRTSNNTIRYDSTLTKATVSFNDQFRLQEPFTLDINTPDLTVTINTLLGTQSTEPLKFVFYMSLEKQSKVYIDKHGEHYSLDSDIYINFDVTEDFDSKNVEKFIKSNHTLISLGWDWNSESFNLRQINRKPETTHGFDENGFGIIAVKGQVYLFNTVKPVSVPFQLCYNAGDCEIKLDSTSLKDIRPLIPKKAESYHLLIGESNLESLNLDYSEFSNIKLSLESHLYTRVQLNVVLGKGRVSELISDNVLVNPTSSDYSIDIAKFKNGGSIQDSTNFKVISKEIHNQEITLHSENENSINGVKEIVIMDKTSWTNRKFTEFPNKINATTSLSKLTFTRQGWKFDSEGILPSNFPMMNLYLTSFSNFEIESDNTNIVPITITFSNSISSISIGQGFEKVANDQNKVTIYSGDLKILTSSFPYLFAFNFMNSNTKTSFPIYSMPFTIPNDVELDNEKMIFDLSSVHHDDTEKVIVNQVSVNGKSEIRIDNSKQLFPLKVQTLIINEDSQSTVSQTAVTEKLLLKNNKALNGCIDVTNSEIVYEWDLNVIPSISFNNPSNTIPSNITFFLSRNTIEGHEEDFNKFIYKKTFNLVNVGELCESWRDNFEFSSPGVEYFNKDESLFDVKCTNGNLVIYGARTIPGYSSGGMSSGEIAGVAIGVIITVSVFIVVGFYYYRKRKDGLYSNLNSEPFDLRSDRQDNKFTEI